MSSSKENSLAKNSVALGLRMIIRMVISLFTTRIILRSLGIEDYGIFNVIAGFTTMFAFVNTSMSTSISRFLSFGLGRHENGSSLRKTFKICFTTQIILAGIVLILAEAIGVPIINSYLTIPPSRISAANILYQCTIITMLINIIQVPFNASIIAYEKMTAYAYIEIINALALLGIAYLLRILSGPLLVYYGLMLVCLNIIILICYYYYTRRFKICIPAFHFNWKAMRPILVFSGADFYSNCSLSLQAQGQNIIINKFFGLVANASIGISNQVYGALLMFSNSITTAIRPRIIKHFAAEKNDLFKSLIFDSSKLISFFNIIACIPLFLSIHLILSLWLTELPEYAILFTRILILNQCYFSYKPILIIGLHATGKITKFSILSGTWYLLSIPLQFLIAYMGCRISMVFGIILIITGINILIIVYYLTRLTEIKLSELFKKIMLPPFFLTTIIIIFEFIIKTIISTNSTAILLLQFTLVIFTIILSYSFILDDSTRIILRKHLHNLLTKVNINKER